MKRLVTVDLQSVRLEDALERVSAEAGVYITFSRSVIPADRRVVLRASKLPLGNVLRQLLEGTGARASVAPTGQVVVAKVAAQGTVVGKVIHAKTKQPVAGAGISVGDSATGIVTGSDGTFRISLPAGEHVLHIRAVGFVRQTRRVSVANDQSLSIEVVLEPSASVLDEVVVTGTVIATERRAITNPITVITAEDIEKRGILRVDQLFRGEVPGVIAVDLGSRNAYNSQTLGGMAQSQVYSRGAINGGAGGATPLKTYVDGIELQDPNYLGTIDPTSIERIEIIAGPQAATVYGSGALGGVMQIFTKKGNSTRSEVVLNLNYGVLQNNLSSGLAPTHNHNVKLSGGTGPGLTYAGTLSLNSSGQWQPFLWNRNIGASLGATHTRGPITASITMTTTLGRNGTYSQSVAPWAYQARSTGEMAWTASSQLAPSQIRGASSSQNVSLAADYRPYDGMQHNVTIGSNQTKFDLVPMAPQFVAASDSLFQIRGSSGKRVTAGYNLSAITQVTSILKATIALGVNGSSRHQTQFSGAIVSPVKSSLLSSPCFQGPLCLQ